MADMICPVCEGTRDTPLPIGKSRMPFPIEWKLCRSDYHDESKWEELASLEGEAAAWEKSFLDESELTSKLSTRISELTSTREDLEKRLEVMTETAAVLAGRRPKGQAK